MNELKKHLKTVAEKIKVELTIRDGHGMHIKVSAECKKDAQSLAKLGKALASHSKIAAHQMQSLGAGGGHQRALSGPAAHTKAASKKPAKK